MAALRRGGQTLRLGGQALLALRVPAGPRRTAAAGSVRGGAVVTPGAPPPPPPAPMRPLEDSEDRMTAMLRKNPDYHGFDDDPVMDLWNMRIVFFFSISVCIVIGFTLMHYMPDNGMQEWARREAERLVRQREAQGLPVLDPNYYDPKTLVFPPQDED